MSRFKSRRGQVRLEWSPNTPTDVDEADAEPAAEKQAPGGGGVQLEKPEDKS